jgi:hypothetical protein
MPVEQLVQYVCNMKQSYTQHGGMRPFGVSFLYAGWDKYFGFQLYQSDPSGNYSGWKATCIGGNLSTAQSIFKTDYVENLNLEGIQKLAVKVLSKTIETTKLDHERRNNNLIFCFNLSLSKHLFYCFFLVEVVLITKSDNTDDDTKIKIQILSDIQVDSFIKTFSESK